MTSRTTHALYAIKLLCSARWQKWGLINSTCSVLNRQIWALYWGASDTANPNSRSQRKNILNAAELLRHACSDNCYTHSPKHLARHKHKRVAPNTVCEAHFHCQIVQCVRGVAVHLQKFWKWCPRTVLSKNWIKQLHTLPVLQFNRCLTECSATAAHFNRNFDTDNQIYLPWPTCTATFRTHCITVAYRGGGFQPPPPPNLPLRYATVWDHTTGIWIINLL
jgi:hypothetical protein